MVFRPGCTFDRTYRSIGVDESSPGFENDLAVRASKQQRKAVATKHDGGKYEKEAYYYEPKEDMFRCRLVANAIAECHQLVHAGKMDTQIVSTMRGMHDDKAFSINKLRNEVTGIVANNFYHLNVVVHVWYSARVARMMVRNKCVQSSTLQSKATSVSTKARCCQRSSHSWIQDPRSSPPNRPTVRALQLEVGIGLSYGGPGQKKLQRHYDEGCMDAESSAAKRIRQDVNES